MHRWLPSLDPVSLVYLSTPVPIAHHVNYCTFLMVPGAGRPDPQPGFSLGVPGPVMGLAILRYMFLESASSGR